MNCNYCNGDEAIFWENEANNAFIDSKGEMMVTDNGNTIRFKVNNCPMCGKRFADDKYLKLKSGDDIYYVDEENNEIEHGKIFLVSFKNGKVDSFSVNFDCGDFDEFCGSGLGTHFFINKEEAEDVLKKANTEKHKLKAIDIDWDVDDEEDLENLPTEIEIPEGMEDEDEISDYLSDVTGFCHKGFSLVEYE